MQSARRLLVTLVILTIGLATGSAYAESKEEARRHFNRAVELVDDGQPEGALVEFQRSYDLTHHFAVLYNIAQVLGALGRPVEAFDAYQRYLADGHDQVPSARRIEVEKEMARQKARIAAIEIYGLPDGAMVYVDGKAMGKAPAAASFRVAVGKHAITAIADGYEPSASEVTVAGEDHKSLELRLPRKLVPAPPAPIASPAPPPQSRPPSSELVATPASPAPSTSMSGLRIAGIVSASVGVAAIAAGTGLWLAARSRHDDATKVYLTDYAKAENLQSEAQGYVTAANISLAAGGALVALGVVSFVLGRPSTTSAGMHAYLSPSVGPMGAGLSAGGVW